MSSCAAKFNAIWIWTIACSLISPLRTQIEFGVLELPTDLLGILLSTDHQYEPSPEKVWLQSKQMEDCHRR